MAPVQFPVEPMLAKLTRSLPTSAGLAFEPKWDGFRCIAFIDGSNGDDGIVLQSRNQKRLNRYFPELPAALADAFDGPCVVDGEIVVPDPAGRGLDFDTLSQRIHPAESRVAALAVKTPAHFVAFDLLAVGDESLLATPFAERRVRLTDLIVPNGSVHLTPLTTDVEQARVWFERFEGAGLDGVVAKAVDGVYEPGKRALLKVKHQREADCVVAGFRVHKDGIGVGSLLLGLWDADARLHHVGVCASFSAAFRRELADRLAPLAADATTDHPWHQWIDAINTHRERGTVAGGGSRWNANKDMSFVPLRPELVAEVSFGQLENGRFRHGVTFRRWRPDRSPRSCTFDQLDVAQPVSFFELIEQ